MSNLALFSGWMIRIWVYKMLKLKYMTEFIHWVNAVLGFTLLISNLYYQLEESWGQQKIVNRMDQKWILNEKDQTPRQTLSVNLSQI